MTKPADKGKPTPSPEQVDPGLSVAVKSNNVTIALIMETGNQPPAGYRANTSYYWLQNPIPADATGLVLDISRSQTPGEGRHTFAVSPPSPWTGGVPGNNTRTFVDNTNGIAVSWDFFQTRGDWSGSATWFNTSQGPIGLTGRFALTNNTQAVTTIQYQTVDTCP